MLFFGRLNARGNLVAYYLETVGVISSWQFNDSLREVVKSDIPG